MNYLDFRQNWIELGCFNINQIYAWQQDFDRNNLTRWVKKGLLIRLRQGLYTFPEYKSKSNFAYFFANSMYKPSYISLHTALSFYGIIPEAVVQITSVTSLKTAMFKNEFGDYSYKKIQNKLMFGYELKPIEGGREIKFAKAERALLDLLYLYSFYNTEQDIVDLRLDEDFIHNELDVDLLKTFSSQFQNKALETRLNKLFNVYDL